MSFVNIFPKSSSTISYKIPNHLLCTSAQHTINYSTKHLSPLPIPPFSRSELSSYPNPTEANNQHSYSGVVCQSFILLTPSCISDHVSRKSKHNQKHKYLVSFTFYVLYSTSYLQAHSFSASSHLLKTHETINVHPTDLTDKLDSYSLNISSSHWSTLNSFFFFFSTAGACRIIFNNPTNSMKFSFGRVPLRRYLLSAVYYLPSINHCTYQPAACNPFQRLSVLVEQ